MTGRVVYVVGHYPRLSQTFVTNEVAELRRQGVDVEVVALNPGDDGVAEQPSVVVSTSFEDRVAQRAALRRLARQHPLRFVRFLAAVRTLKLEMGSQDDQVPWRKVPLLAEQLASRPIGALHAHFAWNGAAAAMLLAKVLDVPWSVTLHANDIFARLRNLEPKLRDAAHLVTVCRYNERWLADHHTLVRPVHQVVCGVELPPARERSIDVDVVAVGRLVEKKGFDLLIDAAAQLRASHPDLRVEIVGEGKLREKLEKQITDLGVGDVVHLRGALGHEETLERIAAARVFCLPCRIAGDGDRDSMPVVIKEAMARGVAVVAADVVAVPEMVDDSCGALVPPEDAAALASALARVLDDPATAERLGAAGRARVEERFTLGGEVAKLRAVFALMGAA